MNRPAELLRARGLRARRSRARGLPQLGAHVPGWTVHSALAVVGVVLCLLCYHGFWFGVGIALTVAAVVFPRTLAAWALLLLLAVSQLSHAHAQLDGRFFALLAGLHLLHVVASQTLELPRRSWIELAVFRRPLLRFLAIQVPVQVLAVLVRIVIAPLKDGGRNITLPVFGIVGGVALVVVTVLLIGPLLHEKRRYDA